MSLVLEKKPYPEELTDTKPEKVFFKMSANPFWVARNFDLKKRYPLQWFLKRTFEIFSSICGLLILFPLLVLIAVAVKLESRGPIFFKQERVGLYGKKFYMYKFRSMNEDAEKNFSLLKDFNESNKKMFKMKNDPRITKIGRFIRKYSLDELPQLINVIRGEMSLVGPRPPISREVAGYEHWHHLRFGTLPGITGIWQVSGRAKIKDFDTVVKMDYEYVKKWNILLDFYLLIKTIPVVITAKGAS